MRSGFYYSARAGADAPLSILTAAHLNQIFHCKVLDVGEVSFLLKE
jgi:hypothetical protein